MELEIKLARQLLIFNCSSKDACAAEPFTPSPSVTNVSLSAVFSCCFVALRNRLDYLSYYNRDKPGAMASLIATETVFHVKHWFWLITYVSRETICPKGKKLWVELSQ